VGELSIGETAVQSTIVNEETAVFLWLVVGGNGRSIRNPQSEIVNGETAVYAIIQ